MNGKFYSTWSDAKIIFMFAKFKAAASATNVKELSGLKQCCNPFKCKFQDIPETYVELGDE